MAGGVGVGFIGREFGDAEEFAIEHADDGATEFVRVLVRVEFGLDVRAFGPLPKELFEVLLVPGLGGGEALFFEADAPGDELAAAEGDDVGKERADIVELSAGVSVVRGGLGGGGQAEGDPLDKVVEGGRWRELRLGALVELGGESDSGAADLPIVEGAELAVFGEVGFIDGSTVELGFEEGVDFGEGIDPFEDGAGFFGVLQAEVELFADRVGETSDFAGHSLGFTIDDSWTQAA
jgi:hypothetical protein